MNMEPQHKKDKEETKKKLIKATGEIFMIKGYSGLNASKIASTAGVSKTLIYRYFGNVQELFKAYLNQKDYWISTQQENIDATLGVHKNDAGQGLIKELLENQMRYFFNSREMQQMIRWQISEPNSISRAIADARERMGEEVLEMSDPYFKDSGVSVRAITALLVSGIYLLVLNAKVNGSTFCGIDINKQEDMDEIIRSLKMTIDWAYDKAKP